MMRLLTMLAHDARKPCTMKDATAADPTTLVEAVFEQGRLRPLRPLPLKDGDHVHLRLEWPSKAAETLTALEDLLDSCANLSKDQWTTFEEATERRPFFRESGSS